MKIMMISGLYPRHDLPQYGIFVKELCDALLKKSGIQIDVVVPVGGNETFTKTETWVAGKKMNIFYIPMFRVPMACNLFVSGHFLKREIEKYIGRDISKYDIFHGHGTIPEGYAAVMLAKKYRKKSVVHVHGLDAYFRLNIKKDSMAKMNYRYCKKTYEGADLVLGVSNKVGENVKRGTENVNVDTLYNGYNPVKFYSGSLKTQNSIFKIICVGNLIPIKGIEYLIDALEEVKEKGYKFQCDIFGRGILQENLENKCKEYHLDEVIFKGYQKSEVIAVAMRNSDLFVLPSYYEALGCVYLEAMASGIPVIACESQGISEVIVNEETGILVKEKNSKEIADNIIRLIEEPEYYKKIQEKALETVREYTWENTAQKLKNLYDNVLKD